ncbi:ITGB1 [Mytilus coruscus]|uniref:ITGB1 n=1 Tax=Mytilus coruscus TaxID=42192 RepID=A0A6J8EKR5_MYTCO|nr:ITGB1 [Mytilus coruscus]
MNTVQTGTSYVVIWFLFYVYIIRGEPDWIVNERVSGYGDNLTLFCLIDDCCTKAAGWIKFDPDYKTIYLDVQNSKNNTSKDKYAATTNNTGFSLVIKNIQKEDINIKYLCLYGFEKSRQKVLRQSDAFKGPDQGICRCGNCSCTSNFTGENCGCSTRNDSCVSSDGNKACVQCVVHHTGEYKGICEENCGDRNVLKKPSLPEGYNICEFKDEDDCIFYFTYDYADNNELKIIAQETKECPTKVNVLAIVLGVVIGIVLVGLPLLLILTITINDKRELARFEKETKDAKWDTGESPVYKPATSTYKNPTYAGR